MEHTPLILDGKKAQSHYADLLRARIQKLGSVPRLVIFCVGNNEASKLYIKRKKTFGETVGVDVEVLDFPQDTTEEIMLSSIRKCNERSDVSGIIIQLPLPQHLDEKTLTAAVTPEKDVDALHPYNQGLLAKGDLNGLIPATARGVFLLLSFFGIEVGGKNVVVVGRSSLVGRPLSLLLVSHDATVTIAHSKTQNLTDITKMADIIVTATGIPNLIRGDMIKVGAVVVDVGTTATMEKGEMKLVGDVCFEEVAKKASALSPVPGGVGPMTVYSLFENVVRGCEKQL